MSGSRCCARAGHRWDLDRDHAVQIVLARLGAARSAWNAADLRGEVEQLLARAGVVADPAARLELAEDLTARALARCVPLLDRPGVPEHVRAFTSRGVLAVEDELVGRLAVRGAEPGHNLAAAAVTAAGPPAGIGLDEGQAAAVAALAGDRALVVVEGRRRRGQDHAAGRGPRPPRRIGPAAGGGHPDVESRPGRVGGAGRQGELGGEARLCARLALGRRMVCWTRLAVGRPGPARPAALHGGPGEAFRLAAGDLLLCDEAGMLDQDTARALLTVADEHGARVAFVGDRHQLAAVGRGGVLDHAARWADPAALVTVDVVHRFVHTTTDEHGQQRTVPDSEYAQLTSAMRTGEDPEQVFDTLNQRGQIQIHADVADVHDAIARDAVTDRLAGRQAAVVAATREQVAELNTMIREAMISARLVNDGPTP